MMFKPSIRAKRARTIPTLRRSNCGFTLMEVLIVITIAGLLIGLAVPSFSEYIANTRIATKTDQLTATINMARTESMKRGGSVLICKSNDVVESNPTNASCDDSNKTDWHHGWLLYAAPELVTPTWYDQSTSGPGEETPLVRAQAQSDDGITIVANGVTDGYLHFDQRGYLRRGEKAVFAICDKRGEESGRLVEVSRHGHITLSVTNSTDTARSCTPQ